jgi:2-methylaconitate cis-trans-isomerase PrpF
MLGVRLPAVFMRGGTSKGLVFHRRDLPPRDHWDAIFLAAMGSPDPYGRQLDGMGGGVSSLSKVCIIGPSSRPDADVDYTFAQVSVSGRTVDYGGNCGNMASAVGPFAVDEGLTPAGSGEALVRIHNTNTGKLIHSSFAVADGCAVAEGDLVIPGVSGSGAPVRLDFIDPGGATTGRLLPTGRAAETLETPAGRFTVSMVDAANACVYVRARDLGLRGIELPDALETPELLGKLAAIREEASVAMGITTSLAAARAKPMVPFIALVSSAQESATLSGGALGAAEMDLTLRVISSGQPHRASPLTIALCTSVAAAIEGTVVQEMAPVRAGPSLRIGTPSGVIVADGRVSGDGGELRATQGSFYRTARRLFDGYVHA